MSIDTRCVLMMCLQASDIKFLFKNVCPRTQIANFCRAARGVYLQQSASKFLLYKKFGVPSKDGSKLGNFGAMSWVQKQNQLTTTK